MRDGMHVGMTKEQDATSSEKIDKKRGSTAFAFLPPDLADIRFCRRILTLLPAYVGKAGTSRNWPRGLSGWLWQGLNCRGRGRSTGGDRWVETVRPDWI